jgi:hypothetical protein
MSRKPVAMVTRDDLIIVVCEDGSVWYCRDVGDGEKWEKGTPIPGAGVGPMAPNVEL